MEKKILRTVKGTQDILPESSWKWIHVEEKLHNFMFRYGYDQIRTPAFEKTELFSRGVGEETDIVSKEMYTWQDVSGDSLTLKPELTAPVVRSYIQHNLGSKSPTVKLYYVDSLFRRERPQKGRYRQFHQFGVEAFGSPHPEQDSEVLTIAYNFLRELGIKELELKINSIGSGECRNNYRSALKSFLLPHRSELSETSQHRFDTNPLRILDTKIPHEIEILKNAPSIEDHWTEEDKIHFNEVLAHLDAADIPYTVVPRLVRGLDYYTRTTFEITSSALGAQDALCGGGRYDGLVEMLGGKPTPGIGFAAGIERILLVLNADAFSDKKNTQVYIVGSEPSGRVEILKLANLLRSNGISADLDMQRKSFKAQMRESNRLGVSYVVILGEQEIDQNTATIKDLSSGEQTTIDRNQLLNNLKQMLG